MLRSRNWERNPYVISPHSYRDAPVATSRTAATTIKLLRAKGNALCLECHGPDSHAQELDAEHVLTIFNGKVKLPEDYYQKNQVVILPLKYGLRTSGGVPPRRRTCWTRRIAPKSKHR